MSILVPKPHRFALAVICSVASMHPASASQAAVPTKFSMKYDGTTDVISIHAQQVELKRVLSSLTMRTGIDTRIHPEANRTISTDISQLPLTKAVKQLCQPLNCIVRSASSQQDRNMVIAIEVLPTGDESSEFLPSVIPLSQEMGMRAVMPRQPTKIQVWVQKRLEERLSRLSPERRDEVMAAYHRKQQKHQERRERRELRSKLRKERSAQRRAEYLARKQR